MDFKFKDFVQLKQCQVALQGEHADPDREAAGVSIDSRTIQKGELYFALRGENHDGHDFVEAALQKQAAGAVVERSWWRKHSQKFRNQAVLVVNDSLLTLQESARAYRKKFGIPVIGVTGTNGKTTTKEMIAAVLSKKGDICKTAGNLNNHIGLPLSLFLLRENHTAAVLEMGTNHPGEIRRLCEIAAPTHGLITNIGMGHTEFFGDVHGVACAKMELFEHIKLDGTAFVNLDDPLIGANAPELKSTVTFSVKKSADVTAVIDETDQDGFPAMVCHDTRIKLNLAGSHNLSNALAAVAIGLTFGLDMEDIKAALQNVTVPGKRMEILRKEEILILNDSYNANPDSVRAALSTLSNMETRGKRIFVMGDMLELGEHEKSEHEKIGRELTDYGVYAFLGFGPLTEFAVRATKVDQAEHFQDKDVLRQRLRTCISSGDVVLIKGSRGMQMEDVLDAIGE